MVDVYKSLGLDVENFVVVFEKNRSVKVEVFLKRMNL